MAGINVWGTDYGTNQENQKKKNNTNNSINVWGTRNNSSNVVNANKNTTNLPNVTQGVSPIVTTDETVQSVAPTTPKTNTNVKNTGSSSNSIYSRSMDLMRKAAQMQMNNQLNTLKNSMHQLLGSYQSSQNALNQQLDADINQNEVERYKAQRALRETLANRGALNSGAGRQEALNMSNAYSNRQNAIQQAYNTNMNDLRNNANASLANLDLAYNDSLQNTNSNIMQQLADYYAKGFNTKTDYTIKGGDEWNNMVAELRKQYGL